MSERKRHFLIIILCICMSVPGFCMGTDASCAEFIGAEALPMQGLNLREEINLKNDVLPVHIRTIEETEEELQVISKRSGSCSVRLLKLITAVGLSEILSLALTLTVLYLLFYIGDNGQRLSVIRFIHNQDGQKD